MAEIKRGKNNVKKPLHSLTITTFIRDAIRDTTVGHDMTDREFQDLTNRCIRHKQATVKHRQRRLAIERALLEAENKEKKFLNLANFYFLVLILFFSSVPFLIIDSLFFLYCLQLLIVHT